MFDFEMIKIKRDIKKHFSFLFDLGFRIKSAKYQKEHMRYWEIILYSKDLLVQIYNDRGEIMISICPVKSKDYEWHGLGTLVYFITRGENFIGSYYGNLSNRDEQMNRLSVILKKYIYDIYDVMRNYNETIREQMNIYHQQVLELCQEGYRQSRPESDFLQYVPKRKSSQ